MSEFLSIGRLFGEIEAARVRKKRQLGKYYARPEIPYGLIWCNRCNKACDFSESAAHNAANPGRSRMYIQAECHGESVNILMTFQQWAENEGRRIVAFEDCALPESPHPKVVLPAMPLLLMDRKNEIFDLIEDCKIR